MGGLQRHVSVDFCVCVFWPAHVLYAVIMRIWFGGGGDEVACVFVRTDGRKVTAAAKAVVAPKSTLG